MKVRGIIALCGIAALAVVAVACGGADSEVKVDKGLSAYAGANPGSVEADASESARSAASTNTGSEVAYNEQLGAPAARSAVAPSGMGGDAVDSAMGSAYPKTANSGAFAPLEQVGPLGIVVQGYGRATAPADTANIGFVVAKAGVVYPEPMGITKPIGAEIAVEDSAEGSAGGSAPSQPIEVTPVPPDVFPTPVPPTPITEADLQPLVDAIKAQGVSDADIEITIYPSTYYGPYGMPTARVDVTLRDMSKVGGLIDAGNQAVANSGTIYMQNVGVTYSVNDCDVLLREARAAAVEDARDNGAGLADALGVGLGGIQGASEYSWDPYGYSGCQSQPGGPMPYYEGLPYDPSVAAEVQIVSNVTISFAMQ